MSDVLETIKSRRSIRKYKSDMVPQDKLEKIIEAGTYAATGMGKQSPIIVAVTNKELRDKTFRDECKDHGYKYGSFLWCAGRTDRTCGQEQTYISL